MHLHEHRPDAGRLFGEDEADIHDALGYEPHWTRHQVAQRPCLGRLRHMSQLRLSLRVSRRLHAVC